MSSLIPVIYYGGLLILFGFWIYGIVSFIFDLKNKIIPGLKQYRRGRKRKKEQRSKEREREESEQQLY